MSVSQLVNNPPLTVIIAATRFAVDVANLFVLNRQRLLRKGHTRIQPDTRQRCGDQSDRSAEDRCTEQHKSDGAPFQHSGTRLPEPGHKLRGLGRLLMKGYLAAKVSERVHALLSLLDLLLVLGWLK
jgi:hypothetical protein